MTGLKEGAGEDPFSQDEESSAEESMPDEPTTKGPVTDAEQPSDAGDAISSADASIGDAGEAGNRDSDSEPDPDGAGEATDDGTRATGRAGASGNERGVEEDSQTETDVDDRLDTTGTEDDVSEAANEPPSPTDGIDEAGNGDADRGTQPEAPDKPGDNDDATGDKPDEETQPEAAEEPGEETEEGDDRDEETLQVLEFVLSEDPYAVTIGEVGAIVEMKQITRFPRGPDAVDGVTDLRGEITAVLDPKRLLDIETDDGPSTEDYIVVLDRTGDKQKVAVRVDDVIRVQRYAESDVDRNGDLETLETDSLDAEMIDGVLYKDADGNEAVDLVPWLNIDTIVDNVD